MKLLLLLFIYIFLSHGVNAQLPPNFPSYDYVTYARIIDLKDRNGKAIAKMCVEPPGVGAKICLAHFSLTKDSTGLYVSEFRFMKANHFAATNVTIILQFSRPFENVYFDTLGKAVNVRTTIGGNNGTSFQTSWLAPDGVIVVKVVSKRPTVATISGIAGQIWVD